MWLVAGGWGSLGGAALVLGAGVLISAVAFELMGEAARPPPHPRIYYRESIHRLLHPGSTIRSRSGPLHTPDLLPGVDPTLGLVLFRATLCTLRKIPTGPTLASRRAPVLEPVLDGVAPLSSAA